MPRFVVSSNKVLGDVLDKSAFRGASISQLEGFKHLLPTSRCQITQSTVRGTAHTGLFRRSRRSTGAGVTDNT